VKEGKVGYKDGRPLPAQDEPLHAYITSSNADNVKKAVNKVCSLHMTCIVLMSRLVSIVLCCCVVALIQISEVFPSVLCAI